MTFILICLGLLWLQAFAGEMLGDFALLIRLWLLPMICLALSSPQIRPLPLIILGVLVDGLLGTPLGLHSLELCLIYGCLIRFSEHLGHQTVLGRLILGGLLAVTDTLVMSVLSWWLPFEHDGLYLPSHFFTFAFIQSLLMVLCLPSLLRLTTANQNPEFRLRRERDKP